MDCLGIVNNFSLHTDAYQIRIRDHLMGARDHLGTHRVSEVPLYGNLFQRGSVLNHNAINGRNRFAGRNMKMHMVSWMDMPDDVFFVATLATK